MAEKEVFTAQELKEFKEFVNEFKDESDRAAVILGTAKLDLILYQILRKVMVPCSSSSDELFDVDRPLASFGAKINICYRLGLIDAELARALQLVKKIRNSFAHELSGVSLEKGSHRDRILEIVLPLREYEGFKWLQEKFFPDNIGPSANFRTVVALISLRLSGLLAFSDRFSTEGACSLLPPTWRGEKVK